MKKTYVTKMPNHIGAFLKASRCSRMINRKQQNVKTGGLNPPVFL